MTKLNMSNIHTKMTLKFFMCLIIFLLIFSLVKYLFNLTEASFIALITLSLLMSVVVGFSEVVDSFNLKEMSIKLKEIKEAEANIRLLALATVELVESGTDGLMATNAHNPERYKLAKESLAKLTKT